MTHKKNKHPLGESIREIIFGINDGAIGNLGVVVGLAQATAANNIILLAGFATMFAQVISMSSGTYLSIKSEKEYFNSKVRGRKFGREYAAHKNPLFSALVMALAVVIGTFIPLIPFFFVESKMGVMLAVILTLSALFCVGAFKAKYTDKRWFKSGFEMLIIGAVAGLTGMVIGTLFTL